MSTPLIIGPKEQVALAELRRKALEDPINMTGLTEALKLPKIKAQHMKRMGALSIDIPFGFVVTFSIETNHPSGAMRHMSMSSPVAGKVPSPEGAWMVAEELGFIGSLSQCTLWFESLTRGPGPKQQAINIVQPLRMMPGGTA